MTVLAILFGWAFVVTLGLLVLVANQRKNEAIEHAQMEKELLEEWLTSDLKLRKGNFELEESYQQMILTLEETISSQVNTITYLEETKAEIQETVDFHNKHCLPTL